MMTDHIQIRDLTIYNSRNLYSHRPVMKMVVDIGKYGEIPTNQIPGFNDRLLKSFPGLKDNPCSLGYPGGFLERLNEGTYLAHVLEHVILEMQYMLGYDVHTGKTRVIEEPSLYYLVYEFENEICGLECGKAAVLILNTFLLGEDFQTEDYFKYLDRVSREGELGPSTSAIVNEAKKRGIPITRIGNKSLVRLGYGKHSRLIESTLTDATSCISADISCNKQLTKFLLSEHQIPVPYGKVVYSELSAIMVANQIGMPVVVKPFDGNQGKGVHLNLNSNEEIKAAFREASKYSSGIIVEKFVTGRDYRILVVGGKVCAVSERVPASVTGDGNHTVQELVEIVNEDPNRGEKHEKPLTKIRIDDVATQLLKRSGLTPESVPERGRVVPLRENGNLSTGGTAIDRTERIHPENALIAVRAAGAVGIDIAGIDFVAEDISKSILDIGGAVVEVNTAPGIRMHLFPSAGTPRNVASDIVDLLFPSEETTRFPIVSVTGSNGKTTVARMIAHTLAAAGYTVGMTSTSGTYVGGNCVCPGDNSGPRSARSLLSNKKIDAAVLETARGGIIREGLGYDLADVGLITNITGDHLGLDGIETLKDLAFVKSLVAEAVKPGGYAVLNAEDSMTPFVLERVKSRTILFYTDEKAAERYSALDCVRVYVWAGSLVVEDGCRHQVLCSIGDIPITYNGAIPCNIENALAAVSALYALRLPLPVIRDGVKSFCSNSGRFNLYEYEGKSILLDYGHNPAGYEQVVRTCKNLKHTRLVGVIGMPGDRQNEDVREVGKLCAASFDKIYIKEDRELRGRDPGEIAGLFFDEIIKCGYPKENVKIIENESDALKQAVADACSDDLIVVLYEKLEPLEDYLHSIGAVSKFGL